MRGSLVVGMVAVLLVAGGCTGEPSATPSLLVVATTSIVGDLVRGVVGDDATIEVLVPVGADPHEFAPSARQAASLRRADLVVTSGLGLEAGLVDALDAAREEGVPVLELGSSLDPRWLGDDGSQTPDPHWWLDPLRAAQAVGLIADSLASIGEGDWATRAAAYQAELQALDEEIRALVEDIPEEHRKLVVGHDALGYFAERYGFEVLGVLIPGGATQAAPDPRALAELAAVIRDAGVPAIFAETTLPTNVAETLAAEVGSDVVVVVLYTGSLGEAGSGADTYSGMLRTNATRIAEALS